eukprot:scaffold4.g4915.t1
MVQQGVKAKSSYSFRSSRATGHRAAAGEERALPAAAATFAAGLRPGVLNVDERHLFLAQTSQYLEARNLILQMWYADVTKYLSEEECVAAAHEEREDITRQAYAFLHSQVARVSVAGTFGVCVMVVVGYVNLGILRDDPRVPLPPGLAKQLESAAWRREAVARREARRRAREAAAAAAEGGQPGARQDGAAGQAPAAMEEEEEEHTTEKMLRKQLGERLGMDLTGRKNYIRELVNDHLVRGGPPEAYVQAKRLRARRAARLRREAARRRGTVVVVGAGPAGLTAALHLKARPFSAFLNMGLNSRRRQGVEVVVVEARDRVGGRVHSHLEPGMGAPVDLGASIITGKRRRLLQWRQLCLLLGIGLHELGDELPLLDTATGARVPADVDAAVETLSNQLMDNAAAYLEDMPEEEANRLSFGQALAHAVQQRAQRRAAPPAGAAQAVAGPTAEPAAPAAPAVDDALDEALALLGGGETPAAPAAAGPAAPAQEVDKMDWTASLLADPEPPPAPAAAPAAAPTAAAAPAQQEEQSVEDFLNSVLASPPPAAVALPPAPAPAAGVAGAAPEAAALAEPAAEPAAAPAAAAGGTPAAEAAEAAAAAEGAPVGEAAAPPPLTEEQQRLMHWHWANLEYGCSARLDEISGLHWNDDEDIGGFGGPHCMVVGGYGQAFRALAALLDVRLGTVVTQARPPGRGWREGERARGDIADTATGVGVSTAAGEVLLCDAVVVAVPLGVLKAGAIKFTPPLPDWKQQAIDRLGFGDLNKASQALEPFQLLCCFHEAAGDGRCRQGAGGGRRRAAARGSTGRRSRLTVVLEFPSVFWDDSVDYFGAVGPPDEGRRGWGFMFWNFHRFCGAPILAALVSGAAAREAEGLAPSEVRARAMSVLRSVYPGAPDPLGCAVTQWASDEFARGSYSFVAVGASGDDYDQLAKPVRRRVLFAGEHTIKEHPDTVGGAMLSGLREAVHALQLVEADAAERRAAGVGAGAGAAPAAPAARKRRAAAGGAGGGGGEEESEEDEGGWEEGGRPLKSAPGERGARADVFAAMGSLGKTWEAAHACRGGQLKRSKSGGSQREAAEAGGAAAERPGEAGPSGVRSEGEREERREAEARRRRQHRSRDEVNSEDDLDAKLERRGAATEAMGRDIGRLIEAREGDAGARWQAGAEARARAGAGDERRRQAARENTREVVRALLRTAGGLAATVQDKCLRHSDPEIRKAAQALWRQLAGAPDAAGAGAARPPSAAGSAAGAGGAPRGGAAAPAGGRAAVAAPAAQKQRQEESDGEDLDSFLDAEAKAALKQKEEMVRAMEAAAAAAAATLVAQQAAAAAAAAGAGAAPAAAAEAAAPDGGAGFVDFQEFKHGQKPAKRRPKAKMERSSSRGGGGGPSREGSAGPSKGGSSAGISDPGVRQQVSQYVEWCLWEPYKAKAISKDEHKWILRKAVDKVCQQSAAPPGEEFLNKRQKTKIRRVCRGREGGREGAAGGRGEGGGRGRRGAAVELVEKYVERKDQLMVDDTQRRR